jgi:hypothetical protein
MNTFQSRRRSDDAGSKDPETCYGSVMTKPPNKVQGDESELYPNAWERFEHAVDVVIKSGPKHRQSWDNFAFALAALTGAGWEVLVM